MVEKEYHQLLIALGYPSTPLISFSPLLSFQLTLSPSTAFSLHHLPCRLIEAEYKQMVGNLEEVVVAHSNLLTALEEQSERPSREQRIGGAFLTLAPHLQSVHQCYCSNHPRAVCILEKYKWVF